MSIDNQQCILFFGEDWGRHNSTGQYLASALAANYQIIWVNSLGLREPNFNFSDIKRIFSKISETLISFIKKSDTDTEAESEQTKNILVLSPLAIPYFRFKLVRFLNRKIILRYLKGFLKNYDLNNAYLISACPATADIVKDFGVKKIVYYCADQHYAQPGMNKNLVTNLENKLIESSDLVVVTSKALIPEKKVLAKNIQYLPHGVNYEHLRQSVCQDYVLPDDIKYAEKPLIGYVGSIGNHLNFDFILYLANNIKNGTIIMLGPIEEDVTELPQHKRITYLGMKKYDQLPAYMQNFSVCLLPWDQESERITYAHPTKLREYLSAGVPVVSIEHPEVEDVSDYIYTYKNKEGLLDCIQKITDSEFNRLEISNSMQNEDWSHRSKTLLSYIEAVR